MTVDRILRRLNAAWREAYEVLDFGAMSEIYDAYFLILKLNGRLS